MIRRPSSPLQSRSAAPAPATPEPTPEPKRRSWIDKLTTTDEGLPQRTSFFARARTPKEATEDLKLSAFVNLFILTFPLTIETVKAFSDPARFQHGVNYCVAIAVFIGLFTRRLYIYAKFHWFPQLP